MLGLARPLADVIWELETEGKPADTPERRASIRNALLARVGTIADGSVQSYYRSEMNERLHKAHRPPPSAGWEGGRRRPLFRGRPGPEPAPFAAGTAARLSGADLDSSRQERALLGALIERPALLHVVADDLRTLEIAHPELARLENALLEYLVEVPGVDPAAEEALGDGGLEERLLMEHLQRLGLEAVAAGARARARELFREKENEAWLERWHRTARRLIDRRAADAHLREAQENFAACGTDEALQHLEAALKNHKAVAAAETG
jgi:DNA primase